MAGNAEAKADVSQDWEQATTLHDLARLTADWLEGSPGEHPNGYDRPDDETESLIPTLARVNRAGFLTVNSQPGHEPKVGHDGRT